MELRRPNWSKINLCSEYLMMLDRQIEESEFDSEQRKSLECFYFMVFNVAYYEFVLAFADMSNESGNLVKEYLDKYKKKYNQNGGFTNGGFTV